MKKHHSSHSPGQINFDLNMNYYSQFAMAMEVLPEGAKAIIAIFKVGLDYILSVFTIPLEVLLLSQWGTRALSLFQAVQVTVLTAVAYAFHDKPLFLFFVVSMGVTWFRFGEARHREWERRPYRYSYTPGEPVVWKWVAGFLVPRGVPAILFSEWVVFRLLEPITGILFGLPLLLLPFTRALGIALVAMGIALLAKRHIMHLRFVEVWRDKADAEVIGQTMTNGSFREEEKVHLVTLAIFASPEANPIGPRKPTPPLKPTASPEPSKPLPIIPAPSLEPIRVVCGGCNSKIKCPVERAGETLTCPKCHSDLFVPST